MRGELRRWWVLAALVGVGIGAAAGTAGANVSLTQVGAAPATTAAFDEGMYSPGLLAIASAAQATRAAQTDGQTTGDGTGAALQALKED